MKVFGMEIFQTGGTYSSLPSVPRNEIVIFDKDTVVLGYSLLIDADDGVVYFTSGSGAGGHTGGAAKPSGTWTQPTHSHGVAVDAAAAHTHTMGLHVHGTSPVALNTTQIPPHNHYVITSDPGIKGAGPWARQWASGAGCTWQIQPDNPGVTMDQGSLTMSGNTHEHGATGQPSNNTSDSGGGHAHTASSAANGTANTWRPTGRCFTRQQRI